MRPYAIVCHFRCLRSAILADVQRGDPPASVAKPRVMTKFGVQARIERGVDNPDRSELLSIKVKPRRLGQPT